MGKRFKFQVQDNDLEYYLGRFDKHIVLSEKKLPLVTRLKNTVHENIQDNALMFSGLF